MAYLLDTNICIYLIKNRPPAVLKHLLSKPPEKVGISAVTLAELEYGVEKSAERDRNHKALVLLTTSLQVFPFGVEAASHYGIIRAYLEKKGQVIGPMDMMIAAHSRSMDWTLVTNNLKEFSRVPELTLENWSK